MGRNMSAKDIAFDKERLEFRKKIKALEDQAEYWRLEFEKEEIIRKHDEEIIEECESKIKELTDQIGIPKEELLSNIERTKKVTTLFGLMKMTGYGPFQGV
jgi:hypothetical protein